MDNITKTQRQNLGQETRIHDLEAIFNSNSPTSQLDRIRKKNIIRVAVAGKKAYWVHENVFYEADVVDGRINNQNAKPIDAHKLSSKELNRLLMILDSMQDN